MDLLFNDLSIHGQFHDVDLFHQALERLMKMRAVAKNRFGQEIYCNSTLANTSPGPRLQMLQAINQLRDKNKRRAVMLWLTKGPFRNLSEQYKYSENALLKCVNNNQQVAIDTAIGEAALRVLNGSSCGMISFKPSDWQSSPIKVNHREGDGQSGGKVVDIDNFLDSGALASSLQNAEPSISSWDALENAALNRFQRLTFAQGCFKPLAKHPFAQCSAETLVKLLHVLSQLADERDKGSAQSVEDHQIYKNYFTGDKAWFSDSSQTEKRHFKRKLTFPHPERPNQTIFCPYHGKERHSTLRLHFSWPIKPGKPVYVVYIGPKLTKK